MAAVSGVPEIVGARFGALVGGLVVGLVGAATGSVPAEPLRLLPLSKHAVSDSEIRNVTATFHNSTEQAGGPTDGAVEMR